MQNITEEMSVHKEWYKEAADKSMTLETLPAFLKKLTEGYGHDYGTICHALAAGAIATAWAMNRTAQGGITGFQGGAIMWEFIRNWNHETGPLKLVRYEDMLYPQYAVKFAQTITPSTWKFLQEEAAKNLKDKADSHPNVLNHWHSITCGVVPFGYVVEKD